MSSSTANDAFGVLMLVLLLMLAMTLIALWLEKRR